MKTKHVSLGQTLRTFLGFLAAIMALMVPAVAATKMGDVVIDPQNLIADDIEMEALRAYHRQSAVRAFRGSEIVIVDYRLPSSRPRLFIVDLSNGAVDSFYVSHGRGSDPGHTKSAQRFSDIPSTGMSSVGAFRGADRYRSPNHGPALRLIGLDATNRSAYDRLIVFHTAPYFDPAAGRFGRSCGCFVVPKSDMTRVYDVVADNGFLYAGPATLHDETANFQRDCNTACGNRCPDPLIADARKPARSKAVAVARAAPPPPADPVIPAPRAPAPLPAVAAVTAPAAPVAPVAAPPADTPAAPPILVARAEPAAPSPVPAARADGPPPPLPIAKPAGVMTAMAQTKSAGSPVLAETQDVPLPIAKPAGLSDTLAVAEASDAAEVAAPVIARLVPDFGPGETPVPSPKPLSVNSTASLEQPL